MTSDNDDMSEMDELQRTDADIEAILAGDLPSGDAAVDAALAALRDLGRDEPPAPSAELRQVLGAGLASVPASGGRTTPKGRHIATGSATLAGVILASATAAAAIGVHQAATRAPEPSPAPRVTHMTPATPRPAPTTSTVEPATGPALLPVLPSPAAHHPASTVGSSGHEAEHADHPASPGSGDDADEQGTRSDVDGKPSARPTPSRTDDDQGDDGGSSGDGDSDHHGGGTSGGDGDGSGGAPGGGSGGGDD